MRLWITRTTFNWKSMKNFLRNWKKRYKYRLDISEEYFNSINEDLNALYKNVTKTITINHEVYHYTREEFRAAKGIYAKYDQDHLLMALFANLSDVLKIKNQQLEILIKLIKYATLINLYPLTKKDSKNNIIRAQNIFKILFLKNAALISDEFYFQSKEILFNQKNINQPFEFINDLNLNNFPAVYNWNRLLSLTTLILNILQIPQATDIAYYTTGYYILKREMAVASVRKTYSIIKVQKIEYATLSDYQLIYYDHLNNILKTLDNKFQIKYMRFLSETEGKIYLSDVPPLTVSGWIGLILNYIILICWALIILWPIYQLIKASVNTFSKETINTDNFEFSFSNFKYLFKETYYGQWLQNSIIVASLTMVFTVIVISLIGYAFSRFRFRGKKSGLMTIMLLQMIPTFTAIIAFYVIFQLLKEGVNMPPLMVMTIIYTGGGIAGNTFVLKGYLDNISSEIDDAARIDGCGNWKIYLQIILPLARPMLAIIALWSFIGPFGDIILPQLLLPSVENYTVASGLSTLISNPNNMAQGAYAAGALIIGLPITILFVALQKNITGGLSAAGVKG